MSLVSYPMLADNDDCMKVARCVKRIEKAERREVNV